MSELLDKTKVVSQYIDEFGKCRIVNYDNISLVTSPLPPFDHPTTYISDIIKTTISVALEFIKNNKLIIKSKDVDNSRGFIISGLWIECSISNPPISFGYIPIDDEIEGDKLQDIPNTKVNLVDTIISKIKNSSLYNFYELDKIAKYLQEYSLYEWSHDPINFNKNSFIIIQNYSYNNIKSLSDKFIRYNTVLYRDNRLIVPNNDCINKLLKFVYVMSFNDNSIIDRYKNKLHFPGNIAYSELSDFNMSDDQVLFLDRESLVKWKRSTTKNLEMKVNYDLYSLNKEPYYYRNINVLDGTLCIIQNTMKRDFNSALIISKSWENVRINIGYNPIELEENIDTNSIMFEVYTKNGLTHSSDKFVPQFKNEFDKSNIILKIFGYDDGSFAALLPLNLD